MSKTELSPEDAFLKRVGEAIEESLNERPISTLAVIGTLETIKLRLFHFSEKQLQIAQQELAKADGPFN